MAFPPVSYTATIMTSYCPINVVFQMYGPVIVIVPQRNVEMRETERVWDKDVYFILKSDIWPGYALASK